MFFFLFSFSLGIVCYAAREAVESESDVVA
jgi:hypothetical protein